MNLIKFFDVYSPYYDDLFADILSKHATQDLTDDIFDLLENGTDAQKTYAAKYFAYIPDTVAIEPLSKYAFYDDENLSYNAAEALGEMQDDISFDLALGYLDSNDDFERLKAVKFFSAYGKNHPLKEIFESLKTSNLKENISGQIPYIADISALLESEYKEDAMIVILHIIEGLGEILPISDIFRSELYSVIEMFINHDIKNVNDNGKIAVILLSALIKFSMFEENQEYTFDETKDTKNEINRIYKLLNKQPKEFWEEQKKYLIDELKNENDFSLASFNIIQELKINEAAPELTKLLGSENEIIICDALVTLKDLNKTDSINIKQIASKIQNENIKAVIENI